MVGVNGIGSGAWAPQSSKDRELQQLYDRILQQTGDPEMAGQAVASAQAALDDIFHSTMVATGGDEAASQRAEAAQLGNVIRLAGLIPQITGDIGGNPAGALREAVRLLEQTGMSDRTSLYPWLHQHVKDDSVLRAAGFDPEEVHRPPDSPWAHADLDALLGLARDMLVRYRTQDGVALTEDQIQDQLDVFRAAAERLGVGQARLASPNEPAPEGTVTTLAFSFPRRV